MSKLEKALDKFVQATNEQLEELEKGNKAYLEIMRGPKLTKGSKAKIKLLRQIVLRMAPVMEASAEEAEAVIAGCGEMLSYISLAELELLDKWCQDEAEIKLLNKLMTLAPELRDKIEARR